MKPISVFIVEDDRDYASFVKGLLRVSPEFSFSGLNESLKGVESVLEALKPQVLLLDIQIKKQCSLDQLPTLRRRMGGGKIVILTVHDDDNLIFKSLTLGADGYLDKKLTDAALLQNAIKDVVQDRVPISGSVAWRIRERFRQTNARVGDIELLTQRETQVLELLCEGMEDEEIAERLRISAATVRTHVRNTLLKLQAKTRVHAARRFWTYSSWG